MANADCTQIDSAEFELGLQDIEAVGDALELLASLTTDGQDIAIAEDIAENLGRVSSVLHVLGDYLGIRSRHLRSIGEGG